MAITSEHVEYVAHLARLELSEEEKKRFSAQLDGILEYMGKLQQLDTDDVDPLVHLSDRKNSFRDKDVPGKSLSRKEALENAPQQSEGCFKVPSIIE